MTKTEIKKWCWDRVHVPVKRHSNMATEKMYQSFTEFSTGETYECTDVDIGGGKSKVTHKINGNIVLEEG